MQTTTSRISDYLVWGFALSVLVFMSAGPLSAKDLPSDEVEVSTPVYFPADDHEFREGIFEYEVAWQGIPAANIEIQVKKADSLYEVAVVVSTNSFVDVFYKLRYSALGSLSANDFSPGYLLIDQRENSRITKASLSFTDDGRIKSLLTKKKSSGKSIKEYDFNPENFTLEPLSAAFFARSLDWEPGVERSFDTFDAKSRYLVTLKCLEQISVQINNSERPVWIIEPTVKNLNKNENAEKLRKAFLYVTADKYRDILQLKSEVFVGSVTTELKSFRPFPEPALQVAQTLPLN